MSIDKLSSQNFGEECAQIKLNFAFCACSRFYETSISYCRDQTWDLQTRGHWTIPWSRTICYMPNDLYTVTLVRSVQRSNVWCRLFRTKLLSIFMNIPMKNWDTETYYISFQSFFHDEFALWNKNLPKNL